MVDDLSAARKGGALKGKNFNKKRQRPLKDKSRRFISFSSQRQGKKASCQGFYITNVKNVIYSTRGYRM